MCLLNVEAVSAQIGRHHLRQRLFILGNDDASARVVVGSFSPHVPSLSPVLAAHSPQRPLRPESSSNLQMPGPVPRSGGLVMSMLVAASAGQVRSICSVEK